MPREPEVHGLVALMEIQASRLGARVGAEGEPVLLGDQDRAPLGSSADRVAVWPRWSGPSKSEAPSARTRCRPRSPHATRVPLTPQDTDWVRVAALYEALAQLSPSPVVELNRAVAVASAFGPAAGLEALDPLLEEPSLAELPSAAERARRPAGEARPL